MSKEQRVIPLRREGYFNNDANDYPDLPRPRAVDGAWKGKRAFLAMLEKVEGKAPGNRYKGYSKCRLCGEHNGTTDHKLEGWVWPEGYSHYVEVHNLRPSTAFIDFIMSFKEQ